tara:strand:- start:558 stop:731 length:174 start_codon:yes stop_codon:yes gene_type:complete
MEFMICPTEAYILIKTDGSWHRCEKVTKEEYYSLAYRFLKVAREMEGNYEREGVSKR